VWTWQEMTFLSAGYGATTGLFLFVCFIYLRLFVSFVHLFYLNPFWLSCVVMFFNLLILVVSFVCFRLFSSLSFSRDLKIDQGDGVIGVTSELWAFNNTDLTWQLVAGKTKANKQTNKNRLTHKQKQHK
jgi:hypothetical protein